VIQIAPYKKYYRKKEMRKKFGVSDSTLDRMEAAGKLPPREKISERAVGWRADLVDKQ